MTTCSIFIASSTTSGWCEATRSPSATRTSSTVPGIGAVTRPSAPAEAPPERAAASTSSAGSLGAVGRLSRKPSRQPAGAGRGGRESGGNRVRKSVVSSPARNAGCATSQRRKGRFVVTPSTSVSSSAPASRSRAASRSTPCATSFAIIGS